MIHSQYYALSRAIAKSFDKPTDAQTINQWDFNYNSITFDQLKKYKDTPPGYPRAVLNISTIEKIKNNQIFNYDKGMYIGDALQTTNTFPLCEITSKNTRFYAAMSRYNITVDITITFETGAQLLDNIHAYNEYFPVGLYYYDFKYDYYIKLPEYVKEILDPYQDETINIFAKQQKDDASNYEYFSLMENQPIFLINSISPVQDKNSDSHQIMISLTIMDHFISSVLVTDKTEILQAKHINVELSYEDRGEIYPLQDILNMEIELEPEEPNTEVQDGYQSTTNNDTEIRDHD